MMATVRVAALLGFAFAAGCGLGLDGLAGAPPDGGAIVNAPSDPDASNSAPDAGGTVEPDSGGTVENDASSVGDAGVVPEDAGQSAAAPCSPSSPNPCIVVPPGWTLVAFAPSQSTPCPAGFGDTPKDVTEVPDAGLRCSCGDCTVTAPPSCAAGPVAVSFDMRGAGPGQCGTTANPSPLMNTPPGACGTDLFTGDYSADDVEYTAPPPTAGTCQSRGVASLASEDRICESTSSGSADCTGNVCTPKVASPYRPCIRASGDVPCPSGPLGARHLVGSSSPSAACPDCPCIVTATCSGTMTLFTDTMCMAGARPFATGQCVPIATGMGPGKGAGTGTVSFRSYVYSGAPPTDVACHAAPDAGTTAAGPLGDAETVCCAN
jgi:hypothetical protein